MLDFKELSQDGNDLELLLREILLVQGKKVFWSGKGPDSGKDLLCIEELDSQFAANSTTWLIQCKHNAVSEKAVGISDLDNIVDSCNHHEATGFLLACSTYPSSKVIERLESITKNPSNQIKCNYWDAVKIEQVLSTPKLWSIAQRFFPISSKKSSLELFATENPSNWIVNLRGYHFHLSNRIGSIVNWHFESINKRIDDIESISLPEKHFVRIRAVWYNDKGGEYLWYLDYMYPNRDEPKISSSQIGKHLGHGYALEDGQIYAFDVITRPYSDSSDHYDKDHYDYYEPFLYSYQNGLNREFDLEFRHKQWNELSKIKEEQEKFESEIFHELESLLNSFEFVHNCIGGNCQIEKLHKFYNSRDWTEIVEKEGLTRDHFFEVSYNLIIKEVDQFFELVEYFPQDFIPSYWLTNLIVTTPNEETQGSNVFKDDNHTYILKIYIWPEVSHNSIHVRTELNRYMKRFIDNINKYKADKKASI